MRVAVTSIVLLSLAGAACSAEPDFDERYEKTGRDVSERAQAIDRELAEQERLHDTPEAGASAATAAPPGAH